MVRAGVRARRPARSARRTCAEGQTDAEAYARIVSLRYLLLRTHRWDAETLERLREELRRKPPRDEDTLTHTMRGDLRG